MTEPPMQPEIASADLIARMSEVLASVMTALISRGTIGAGEAQDLLTARLVRAPATRLEQAQNLLLENALMRLVAAVPRSGRA
jgi:hypothetical protein